MSKQITLPVGVTADMVAKWKEEHGADNLRIAHLCPELPKALTVVVRVPDRVAYNLFDKWLESDPGKAKDILINACLLTNKDEVKADTDLYFSCYNAIAQILPLYPAIVESL